MLVHVRFPLNEAEMAIIEFIMRLGKIQENLGVQCLDYLLFGICHLGRKTFVDDPLTTSSIYA